MGIAEKKIYNFNSDGSVRAEFVIIGQGVVPVGYFAKMLGVHIAEAFDWNKSDLCGMLLDAAYVNDDGYKCDAYCKPVEDDSFALLPGNKAEKWNHQLWVTHDGSSAVTDEEWGRLSAEGRASYRRLNCMAIQPSSELSISLHDNALYVTEEAVSTLAEMLVTDMTDTMIGDPIMKRYQYECKFNEAFAEKYGFVLDMALEMSHEAEKEERFRRQIAGILIGGNGSCREKICSMILGCRHVDDSGQEVPMSEDDSKHGDKTPADGEDTSTYD